MVVHSVFVCVSVCVSECASAVAAAVLVLKQEFERDQVGCVLIGLLLLLLLPVNEPNRKRQTHNKHMRRLLYF